MGLQSFEDPCLHTADKEVISIEDSDKYQYLLTVLMWVIMIPILCMIISVVFRHSARIVCYPFLVANLIFGALMAILGVIVIIFVVIYSLDSRLKLIHMANGGALVLGILVNQIYLHFFDAIDLMKL